MELAMQIRRRRPRGPMSWGALLCVALAMAGCQSTKPKPTRPAAVTGGDDIAEIHLLSSPAAVNFDSAGGAAGFAVRVFASSPRSAKTVAIGKGSVEIQMFDGVVSGATASSAKPLRVWSFTAEELRPYLRQSAIGSSYTLTLLWGQDKPTQNRITIVAGLSSPRGRKIYSALTTIFVSVR
jgi:hypothetical protein